MALSSTTLSLLIEAIDNASPVIKHVEDSASSLGGTLTKVTQGALGFAAGIAAIAGIGSAIDAVGGVVVGFNSKMEQSAISWKTFTGSADAASAVLGQIQQLAATTPFEFADVDNAAKRFVNAGFSAQGALDLIKPLSNAVASVGLGAAGVDRVSLALSQMTSKTKVQGDEMLQLTEAQIPAWDILAQATGKPIPELQKLVTQGRISAKEFTDAFASFYGDTGKFADAAHDQSLTFAGSLSTIHDQLNIIGSTAFKPLFDALSTLARSMAAFVQSDQFTVWGAKIQAVVGIVVEGLGGLTSAFTSTLGGVLSIVNTLGKAIYDGLQWINPFATHSPPLVSQVQDGVAAIQTSYESLGGLSTTFAGIGTAFESLAGQTATFSDSVDGMSIKTEKALAVMGPGVTAAFGEASAAMDTAKGTLADIKEAWDSASDALAPLKDNLGATKDALKDQQSALGDLKSQLSDAKAAFDPLNDALKDAKQNASDAESAIRALTNTPVAGTAEFDKKISDANIALKQQALELSNVKNSSGYLSLGDQIDAATAKLKEMQRTQSATPSLPAGATAAQRAAASAASDAARATIAQQQAGIDALKAKQAGLIEPAQKKLDLDRNQLDTINLQKDATIGVAQEQIKQAALAAQGIKEQTQAQIQAGLATAGAQKQAADAQVDKLTPQVQAQQAVVDGLTAKILDQQHAVDAAQKATDAANQTYSDAKEKVDDLGSAYRDTKAEVAAYEQQLKSTITAGDTQVQKINAAATAAKAAAKAAASAPGAGSGKTDVLAGLDIEGSKVKIKAFSDQVAATRAGINGNLDALRSKWDTVWTGVQSILDRVLGSFGGAGAVQPAIDFLQRFAGMAAGLGAALVIASPLIGLFASALAPIGALLAAVVSPIGLLVIGIAALSAAWTLNIGGIQDSMAGLTAAFAPLDQLPAVIDKAFGGDVTGALTDFVNIIEDVRSRVIETLAGWGAAFVDWLLPQLPALTAQLTRFASVVIGWILDQGDKFLANLLKWGSAFVDWLAPRIPAIIGALTGLGLQILQWIRDQGTIIAGRLGEWAAAFIDWVIPLLPKIGTALKQIAGAIIDYVGTAVPLFVGALADWAGAFLGWVVPLLPDLLGAMATLVGDLTVWLLEEGLPKIAAVLITWGAAFIEWVQPRILPLLAELGLLTLALLGWIKDRAGDIAQKLLAWGSGFIAWIAPLIKPFLEELGLLALALLGWIKDRIPDIIEQLAFWAGAFYAWAKDVADKLPGELKALGTAFLAWIGDTATKIGPALEAVVQAVKDWITGGGAQAFTTSGEDLGKAMVDGIISGLSGLKDALGNAIGTAVDAAKRGFSAGQGSAGAGGAAAGSASAYAGGSTSQWNPAMVEQYIRQAAPKYGIDPGTAAHVAATEGLNNPVGDAGKSFGPYQLYTGGGLGNAFKNQTGLDPADYQNNWQQQVEFALDWASKNGWNPGGVKTATGATGGGFHGATAAGIGNWQGIGTATGAAVSAANAAVSGPSNQDILDLANPMHSAFMPANQSAMDWSSSADAVDTLTAAYDDMAKRSNIDTGSARADASAAGIDLRTYLQGIGSGAIDATTTSLDALSATGGTAFDATIQSAQGFADQFGISLDAANKILSDHGAAAQKILGTDIPSGFVATDDAVERFADAFGIGWDQARDILNAGGATADAVMGNQIPAAAQTTINAVGAVGAPELWDMIRANASDTGRDLSTYMKDIASPAIDLATASLKDLQARSGLSFTQVQQQAAAAGKDVRTWLLTVGVPAADALAKSLGPEGVTGAATNLKKPVDDANSSVGGLKQPVDDAKKAIDEFGNKSGDAGTKMATQFSAVLQQLVDHKNDNNIFVLTDAVQALADKINALHSVSIDITTNYKSNGTPSGGGSSAASSGGGGGGGGGSSSSSGGSSGGSSDGGVDFARAETDQGYRDQLRDAGNNVGRDDSGKLYVEKKASGGPVRGGTKYLVGEMGPELFVPNSIAQMARDMLAHPSVAAARSAAGNMPYPIGESGQGMFVPPVNGFIVPAGALKNGQIDSGALKRLAPQGLADAVIAATQQQASSMANRVASLAAHLSDSDRGELGLEKRELGGPVQAGKSYVVGERRAEIFTPHVSGSVATHLSIDYDKLAAKIGDRFDKAMDNMPAPRVAIDDVHGSLLRKKGRNGTLGLS